jgi:hypothetical protein
MAAGKLLMRLAGGGFGAEEELIDGVELDAGGEFADDLEHFATDDLVPAEVAFDVDAVGAFGERFPDGLPGGNPRGAHFIAFGDDAGALVAEDADGLADEKGVTNPLRRDVEAIGVEMSDSARGFHEFLDASAPRLPRRSSEAPPRSWPGP